MFTILIKIRYVGIPALNWINNMTIRDLMKAIPEEHWDKVIIISIPQLRPGDEGDFPLIEVNIENYKGNVRIYMEADCG